MDYTQKYLTIYRPYDPDELLAKAKSEKEGGYFNEAQPKNWDDALNNAYKKGYRLIKCGLITIKEKPTFWAILEKP